MLSDDDLIAPHLVERCASLVDGNAELPVIVALGDVFEEDVNVTRPAVMSHALKTGVLDGKEILKEFLRGNISPQMCTVALKTEVLRMRGGFPDDWPHMGDLAAWVPLLLQGDAGFVNERCGTRRDHADTQTARFSLDTRLKDISRLGCVIREETAQRVGDESVVAEIGELADRYVARNFIGHMASQRSEGASRREIASTMWPRRSQLLGIGIGDLRTLPRPLALLILPRPAIQLVKRVKRVLWPALRRRDRVVRSNAANRSL
jgi:hypothetical protein